MANILEKILATKRDEIAARYGEASLEAVADEARASFEPLGFIRAITQQPSPRLIAEVKKASPSKGVIRADFDPVSIAQQYESGGATCLSVLTDEQYFQGHIDYLTQIRNAVSLPLLRKDFIIDPIQIWDARRAGASAVLLIAAALDENEMNELAGVADEANLDVLMEVHDEDELASVVASGVPFPLIGVNNRNLKTFEVTLETTEKLAKSVLEAGASLVAESGIYKPEDVDRVARAGASAVLVGESLMRQENVEQAARTLMTSPGAKEKSA